MSQEVEMRPTSRSDFDPEDVGDTSTDNILPRHDTARSSLSRRFSEYTEASRRLYRITTGIQPEGESGRSGVHPYLLARICARSSSRASSYVNVLWPFVPAAIITTYSRPDLHIPIFILNYVAMVPCANLIGFAGQELARKLHKVIGILLETTFGSVVEIVMFMVLLQQRQYQVIQAAILGSILATQLLCLGFCFAVGGVRHDELEFDEVVGEVGSDLLLTA